MVFILSVAFPTRIGRLYRQVSEGNLSSFGQAPNDVPIKYERCQLRRGAHHGLQHVRKSSSKVPPRIKHHVSVRPLGVRVKSLTYLQNVASYQSTSAHQRQGPVYPRSSGSSSRPIYRSEARYRWSTLSPKGTRTLPWNG